MWSLVSKSFFVFTSPTSRQLHRFDQHKINCFLVRIFVLGEVEMDVDCSQKSLTS